MALDGRSAAASRPGSATASVASHGGSPVPPDVRTKAAALRQQRVSTAARLQALIARANHIASSTSGSGRSTGSSSGAAGGVVGRPASALQQRRAPVLTEAQRAASAMAMREQLHAVVQHEGFTPAGAHPAPRAGSRLGRLPGKHSQPAAVAHHSGSRTAPSVGPRAVPTPGTAAAGRPSPPSRPSSAAVRQPPTQQQLPALPANRPPSRMQQYGGSQPYSSGHSRAVTPECGPSIQAMPQHLDRQALPPVRPFSAAPTVPLLRSASLGSSSSAQKAEADAAELFAVTREVRSHSLLQQQPPGAAPTAPAEQQVVTQLRQQLKQASDAAGLQAAASNAAAWLALQLQPTATELLHQLVAALRASCSSNGGGGQRPLAGHGSSASPAPPPPAPSGGLRPHQLFQQCGQLRGEKAALERLNAELSSQVAAYQEQLAGLHLRVDNLRRERQRLQEEAAEQAAAAASHQQRMEAETEALRQRVAAAEAAAAAANQDGGGPVDTASAGGGGRPSSQSSGWGGGHDSGRPVCELASEEVTWGRTLTGRAPAQRPSAVPPVDLSRLRLQLPVVAR